MKSGPRGKRTSAIEVTNVTPHGFWLVIQGRDIFVSFNGFPWFRDASIGEIVNVELPNPHHLYWPALDVDLAVESLDHPERYPLVCRVRSNKRLKPAAGASPVGRTRRGRARHTRRGLAADR